MDFLTFLETHQADWPLGKMQTLHETRSLALGTALSHPLQNSDFLRSAAFVQLTICRPQSHVLPLAEVRVFASPIAALLPEDGCFSLQVETPDTLTDAVTVRLLAVQWTA